MFLKPEEVYFEEVKEFDDRTVRSSGGFGSTNKRFFFLTKSKKKADIDFGNYTLNEKENLIKDLLRKQVEIAKRL